MTTSHLSGLLCLFLITFLTWGSGAREIEKIVTKREAPSYKVIQGDILEKSGPPSSAPEGMHKAGITTDTRRCVRELKPARRNMILFHRHWENGKIPFAIDDGFGRSEHAYKIDLLDEVIKGLERDSCVRFENITGVSRKDFPHYL